MLNIKHLTGCRGHLACLLEFHAAFRHDVNEWVEVVALGKENFIGVQILHFSMFGEEQKELTRALREWRVLAQFVGPL